MKNQSRATQSECLNPRADWRETVSVGDVLIMPSGSWRVVREVNYWSVDDRCKSRRGLLAFVELAIRRCSWTGRPSTTLSRPVLGNWSKLHGARAKLDTEADKKLLLDIENQTAFSRQSYNYDCCDAKAFI